MAKLEIPSIVVNNNGANNSMEKTRGSKNRLSKQEEFEEAEEDASSADVVVVGTPGDKKDNHWDRKSDGQKSDKSKTDSSSSSSSSSTLPRQRSHPKVKLLQRSHAVRDDTSPPPDVETQSTNTLCVTSASTLTTQSKGSPNKPNKLGRQGSSQGSMDGSSPCLSRDSSTEQYTDSTGVDLHQFIVDTLHRNQKDRMMLLKIEHELNNFVKDNKRQYHKFPQMSSYQRMLVHRVAAYFGMEHNVDQAGTSVIVNKTKNTRQPEKRFRDLIRDELVPEEPKRSILKRDSSSFEEGKDLKSPERQLSSESQRSKSFEEREEEYEKTRARIFNQDSSSSQEGPVDSPIRSHESTHNSSRRSSQEDLRWVTDPRPWSSTDSDSSNRPAKPVIMKTSASTESDTSNPSSRSNRGHLTKAESAESREKLHLPRSRPASLPKASSFGGISVLVRGDSVTSTRSATPRLTKAESFTSSSTSGASNHRLSPSRANSKADTGPSSSPGSTSPSLASAPQVAQVNPTTSVVVTSANGVTCNYSQAHAPNPQTLVRSTSTESSSQQLWPSPALTSETGPPNFIQGQPVMWAVSNMESVPPGSILINPQTGQPYLNADGSVYRHSAPISAVPSSVSAPTAPTLGSQQLVAAAHMAPPTQPAPPPPQQLQPPVQLQPQVQAPPQARVQPQPQQQQGPPTQLPPMVVYTQLVTPQQSQTHHPETRHFSLDSNTNVGDISGQLSSLSFSDSGASGDGNQVLQASSSTSMNQHGYIMSALRPAGLVATTQGNVAQVRHYKNHKAKHFPQMKNFKNNEQMYVVPPPSVPSAHPLRIVYPVPYVSSQPQPHQSANTLVSGQQQPAPQAQPPPQQLANPMTLHGGLDSQHQVPGQYVPSYPMVGYSQVPNQASGDTYSPYYQMTTHSVGGSAMPNYSYTAPPSLPSVTNGSVPSMSTSQSPFLSGGVAMYGPNHAVNPGPFSHTQGSYRPQTPPTQNPVPQGFGMSPGQTGGAPQTMALNSTYMGYAVYPPPPSTQVQPTTPTTPTPTGQTALYPAFSQPVLTAAFPMFRSGMQLMTVRSSTPPPLPPAPAPPHGLLQTQYNPGPMLTKSYSLPADHRFGKSAAELYMPDASALTGTPSQDGKNLTSAVLSSLSNTGSNVRPSPIYGRGIPLLQNDVRILGGPPLQPQLPTPMRTSLVLPQQRTLARFTNPQQGLASSTNRPPKVRKQRSKGSKSDGGSLSLTPQTSLDLPDHSCGHILEVQNLPEGLKRSEAERYLEEVTMLGGRLQFVYEGTNCPSDPGSGGDFVVSSKYQVLAVFESDTEAQSALVNIKTPKFQLRLLASKPPLEQARSS